MDEARSIIDRLRKRVADIVAEKAAMSSQMRRLDAERERLLKDKSTLERKVSELEHRVKVLELSKGVASTPGGGRAARDRVNRLLREVDKCLALMNRY